LWLSHAPWMSTGYGAPTALWLPKLREAGHEVTAAAFCGQPQEVSLYKGIPVLNADDGKYGATVLAGIAKACGADAVITLMDIWVLEPGALDSAGPTGHWMPVDTTPLSALDEACLKGSRAVPVAMSQYGARILGEAGFPAQCVPYAFDPQVFYPDEADRKETRARLGLDGIFAVGINAANVERKAWPEQLAAYARLWCEHPGQVVLLANVSQSGPAPVAAIAARLGLPDEAIRWSAPGLMDQAALASWYRALDVLSAATYAEGFGLPVVEAEACGVPVIVTDAPPLSTETGLPGRKVACEPVWTFHRAWWHRPSIAALHEALEDAYSARADREKESAAAVEHAAQYAVDAVAPLWEPVLEQVASGNRSRLTFQPGGGRRA
jgi:glycosyltransferase involved in cell wall biosynthesis